MNTYLQAFTLQVVKLVCFIYLPPKFYVTVEELEYMYRSITGQLPLLLTRKDCVPSGKRKYYQFNKADGKTFYCLFVRSYREDRFYVKKSRCFFLPCYTKSKT